MPGPEGAGGDGLRRAKAGLRARMRAAREALGPAERERLGRLACERLLAAPEVRDARVLGCYLAFGSELSLGALFEALAARPRPPALALPVTLAGRRLAFVRAEPAALAGRGRREEGRAPRAPGAPLPPALLEPKRPLPELPPELAASAVPEGELDALVVPGLAFDASFGRLGYGGGYYDAFLARLLADRAGAPPFLVGACFDFQLLEAGAVPAGPLDVPLDAVVTDARMLRRAEAARPRYPT